MNKVEVVARLKSGEFSVNYDEFTHSKRYKSNIWQDFGRVYDNYVPLDFVCCKNCRHVYPYSPRFGTSSLLRHKCLPRAPGRQRRSNAKGASNSTANETTEYSYAGSMNHEHDGYVPAQDQVGQEGFETEDRTPDYNTSQNSGQIADAVAVAANQDYHVSRIKRPYNRKSDVGAAGAVGARGGIGIDSTPASERRGYGPQMAALEKAKIRAKIDRLNAETEFWKVQTKKTHEEVKKLQLEQLRLQKEMGIMEVVEHGSGAEYLMVDNSQAAQQQQAPPPPPPQHHQAPPMQPPPNGAM